MSFEKADRRRTTDNDGQRMPTYTISSPVSLRLSRAKKGKRVLLIDRESECRSPRYIMASLQKCSVFVVVQFAGVAICLFKRLTKLPLSPISIDFTIE